MKSFFAKLRLVTLGIVCSFLWITYARLRGRHREYGRLLARRVNRSRIADIRQIAAIAGVVHGRNTHDAGIIVDIACARERRGELMRFGNRQLLACAEAACWLQDFALVDRIRTGIRARETSPATRDHLRIVDAIVDVGTGRMKVAAFVAAVPTSDAARLFFPQLIDVIWASYFEQCGRRGEAREAYERALKKLHREDFHRPTIEARRRYITAFSRP